MVDHERDSDSRRKDKGAWQRMQSDMIARSLSASKNSH